METTTYENTQQAQPTKTPNLINHLTGIDGIRAIACLAVFMHHLAQEMPGQYQPRMIQNIREFLIQGNSGVSIFFVLSGFLLSYPFWKQYLDGGSFPSIKKYAINRAARIMPGYYVSFFVAILLAYIYKIPTEEFWIRTITGLTFTSGFHYVTFFPTAINGPLWSISFEVFSYILMPLFMALLFKLFNKNRSFVKGFTYWLVVFGVVILLNQLVHIFLTPNNIKRGFQYGAIGGAKAWMPGYNPLGFFGHFAIGIMASAITVFLYQQTEKLKNFKKFGGFDILGTLFFISGASLLWFNRTIFDSGLQHQPYFFPLYAVIISCVLVCTNHSNWIGKAFDNILFRYTAKISFGIYIWHYIVLFVVKHEVTTRHIRINTVQTWLIFTLVILAFSYIIATISYYIIEKPVLNHAHKK